jgi:hypothetical protein
VRDPWQPAHGHSVTDNGSLIWVRQHPAVPMCSDCDIASSWCRLFGIGEAATLPAELLVRTLAPLNMPRPGSGRVSSVPVPVASSLCYSAPRYAFSVPNMKLVVTRSQAAVLQQ